LKISYKALLNKLKKWEVDGRDSLRLPGGGSGRRLEPRPPV
jgi:hypothetical protein